MSNMLRKGKRLKAREDKKVVKKSTKEFYRILGELDDVAEQLQNDQEFRKEAFNEEGIVKYAAKYTDLEIGNLEKMVLMGKLGMYEQLDAKTESVRRGES